MIKLRSVLHSVIVCLGSAFLASASAPVAVAQGLVAADPVGYIGTEVTGGTPSLPGVTYIAPALVNPVEWQGQVVSVNGSTITLTNANWSVDAWGSRYCLEIVNGPYAGLWTEIVSSGTNQLTVGDLMDGILAGDEIVRIRRFTTVADFLGAHNEAGLSSGIEIAFADTMTVYHASGAKNYWYYTGLAGAGWLDASWNRADDTIIAPGEGVVLRRRSAGSLFVYQVGTVKTGPLSIIVEAKHNIFGGVNPIGLRLGDSNLFTGDALSGIASGGEPAVADTVIIYGDQARTYWYYRGNRNNSAGWMDASWNRADDVVIPQGATFVVNRKGEDPFLWFVPSFIY